MSKSECEPSPSIWKKLEHYAPKNTATSLMLSCDIEREVYQEFGCNVLELIGQMYEEQREHNYENAPISYVKHRRVVVQWMLDVCDYFHLHPTTTHLSIAYLDRIQPNDKYSRFEWQMIAICCIVVASKYNECECHVPTLKALETITHQRIPNATFLSYELWTLKRMGWKLHARTPMNFLNCYLNLGIISNNDVYCYDASHNFVYDNRYSLDTAIYGSVPDILTFHLLPRYIYVLSNVSLTEIELKKYLANDIACAVIYISRRNLHLTPVWTEDLMLMTGCEHPSTVSHVIAVMDRLSSKALEAHFQKETLPVLLPRDEELSVNDTVSFDESDCEVTANSGSGLFDDSEHRCNIPAGHEQSMEQFTQYLNELAISGQERVDVTAPVPPQSYARVKNTETKIDMSVIPSSAEKSRGVKPKSDIISPQSIAISSPMIGIVNGRQKTGADMTASIQKNIEKADAIRASIERLVS